jgi:hypothetical protein
MYYFARVVMGLSESEFWKLTLRKYIALVDEFAEINNPQKEKEVFADELLF